MSNYKIIQDEGKLVDFIDNILPNIESYEQFYCCLFARSKYCTKESGIVHIKSDKAQLKRFTSKKEKLLEKIKQLECPIGAYKQRDIIIPQEALALYITTNPRNLWRATTNSLVKLARCIQDDNKFANPHQEVMSEIQRTRGKLKYVTFDIDSKDNIDFSNLPDILGYYTYKIMETRGGYHLLVEPESVPLTHRKNWYNTILKQFPIDQKGDIMSPVIGCTQGNFIPTIIN